MMEENFSHLPEENPVAPLIKTNHNSPRMAREEQLGFVNLTTHPNVYLVATFPYRCSCHHQVPHLNPLAQEEGQINFWITFKKGQDSPLGLSKDSGEVKITSTSSQPQVVRILYRGGDRHGKARLTCATTDC